LLHQSKQSNQPLDSTGNSTTNTKKNTSNDCIGHFWLDQLQHIPHQPEMEHKKFNRRSLTTRVHQNRMISPRRSRKHQSQSQLHRVKETTVHQSRC
ncbi:unnamed protein product, partial [Brassica oleracea]